MTVRAVFMMLIGWPLGIAVAVLFVAACVVIGTVLDLADRAVALFRWPDRVPGGLS